MKVLKRTPRTDMHQDIYVQRIGEFFDDLAKAENVPQNVLDIQLVRFLFLSTRIEPNGDKLDFELMCPGDTTEAIRQKFLAYLDSECVDTIDAWDKAIKENDRPASEITAPDPLPDDSERKKK